MELFGRFEEVLTEEEKIQVAENFVLYCQAKIWQRAVQSKFVAESYTILIHLRPVRG
jgi:hypothetical protein